MGGSRVGVSTRIKDFSILAQHTNEKDNDEIPSSFLVISGSSDGSVRVWALEKEELLGSDEEPAEGEALQLGRLLGIYETPNRITCLESFVLSDPPGQDGDVAADSQEISDSEEEDSM
jgi:protein MAK11